MEKRIRIITTIFYFLLTVYAVGGTVYVLQDFPHTPREIVSVALTLFAVLTITIFSGLFMLDKFKVENS